MTLVKPSERVLASFDWQDEAPCREADPELFFPVQRVGKNGQAIRGRGAAYLYTKEAEAKALCGGCPVQVECLEWALRNREPYGIWGGMTHEERFAFLGLGNGVEGAMGYRVNVRRFEARWVLTETVDGIEEEGTVGGPGDEAAESLDDHQLVFDLKREARYAAAWRIRKLNDGEGKITNGKPW